MDLFDRKMAAKVTVKRKKQVSPELKAGVSTESIAGRFCPFKSMEAEILIICGSL